MVYNKLITRTGICCREWPIVVFEMERDGAGEETGRGWQHSWGRCGICGAVPVLL